MRRLVLGVLTLAFAACTTTDVDRDVDRINRFEKEADELRQTLHIPGMSAHRWRRAKAIAVIAAASNIIAYHEETGIAALGMTTTDAFAVLLVGFVSGFDDDTVAVFETVAAFGGRFTLSEIVAEPPLAIVPSVHVVVDVPLQLPWDGVSETNVVPGGIVSVTTTPAAAAGPALLTTIVYVIGRPVPYGEPDAVFVIDRSAGSEIIATNASKPPPFAA